MEVRDGVLYRRWESDKGDRMVYQIVLRSSLRATALQAYHDHPKASHWGLQRALHSLQLRYYWPGLTSQTYRWVSRCTECAAKKNYGRKRRAPLQQSIVGFPMERIAMNILGPLPKTLRGNRYVLVISDYFTKWTESYLLPDQIATSIAEGCIGIGESFWRTTINPQRPRNKF